MALSGTKDLTRGKPMKLVFSFAFPLLFGVVFQQLYNFVDTAIVGRYLGADKLGAVGSTGSISFLIVGFCLGICSGFAVPVSQRFGAKDYSEMRRYVANAAYLTMIIGVILGISTALFCPDILRLMNTQTDLFADSVSYIRIIFAFIPVTMVYNMAAGILRSLGDSKTPVFFLIVSALINVVLDLLFILVLKMEVAGAAWATGISQAVSGIGCVAVLLKRFPILKADAREKKISGYHIRQLLGFGLPMGLQFSITAIGSVVLQTAVNGISKEAVSAVAAAHKISNLFMAPYDALATTMATFAGQNLGAGKPRRIGQGLRSSAWLGIAYSMVATAVIWLFGRTILSAFLDPAEIVVTDMAYQFLQYNSAIYIMLLYVNILRLTIQGMGYTRVAMFAGVMEMFARTGVATLLIPVFGFSAACIAHPTAWVAADLFLFPCYCVLIRRLKAKYPENSENADTAEAE